MKQLAVLIAGTLGLLSIGQTVSAQTPPANMIPCTKMADPTARLRCYDTQMAAMGAVVASPPPAAAPVIPAAPVAPTQTPPAPPPAAVASATPPPAPVMTPEQKFGSEDLKQSARPKETKADQVLTSTITSIKEVRPKLFIIVLENGQIWMQDGTQITMFFKTGFPVRIEKGLLGGYRMSTPELGDKNMVRVTRIQ